MTEYVPLESETYEELVEITAKLHNKKTGKSARRALVRAWIDILIGIYIRFYDEKEGDTEPFMEKDASDYLSKLDGFPKKPLREGGGLNAALSAFKDMGIIKRGRHKNGKGAWGMMYKFPEDGWITGIIASHLKKDEKRKGYRRDYGRKKGEGTGIFGIFTDDDTEKKRADEWKKRKRRRDEVKRERDEDKRIAQKAIDAAERKKLEKALREKWKKEKEEEEARKKEKEKADEEKRKQDAELKTLEMEAPLAAFFLKRNRLDYKDKKEAKKYANYVLEIWKGFRTDSITEEKWEWRGEVKDIPGDFETIIKDLIRKNILKPLRRKGSYRITRDLTLYLVKHEND